MANGVAVPVRLLVGTENIWAVDSRLQTRLIIPIAEVSSVYSEETESGWVVRLRRSSNVEEFGYRGVFAEHFAKVAENTIRGIMRPDLTVQPKARAARA
jgi:hypothetical protein